MESLKNQTDKDFDLIVVDNASEEADLSNLKLGIGSNRLIGNEKNLGFSGGSNWGIREALKNGSDWVVLLNNDTWVEERFISTLKAKLEASNGIVGMPLIEGDYTAYCGKVKWLKPTLKHMNHPLYTEYLKRNTNYYVIGGAMAIRKDVFDKIGFLDEKYFLYFEDADYCIRANKENVPVSFVDDPKVHHQVSSTTRKMGSPLLLRYHYRNALYFNRKNGPWHVKITLWFWSLWIIKKQMWKILFFYKQNESTAILMGVFDFYRNKMGKIK